MASLSVMVAAAIVSAAPADAWACATCFGNPDSPLAKGALAGVIVLFGFISFVLVGVAGVSVFWFHRSRHLRVADHSENKPNSQ
ncbi:MAG: hypothetical protein IIC02_13420 [Planctomycetes bacterium]|nr:hypothetical protein [Planctomycetota bacterium]